MKKCKNFIQWIGLYTILLGALWLFLIAAAMIPNNLIKENMKKSAITIGKSDAFAYCDGDKMNGIADNYADSIWVNVAWFMGKGSPVKASVDTWYYDGEEAGENIGLYLSVTEETTKPNTDYTRYWHGTAGVIRILHLFTDVIGIKSLGFLMILVLAAVIMILLIRDGKDAMAIAFFLSICAVKIWNVRLSMEYQPAFIIAFLMCIFYLLFEKKGNNYLMLLAVAGGELIAFFDFLTTETVVILLPLILVITVRALDGRIGTEKDNLRLIITQGIAWLASYGMTIFMKWLLASVITGENKFLTALNMAKERVNGNVPMEEGVNPVLQILIAPAANLSVLFGGTKRIEMFPLTAGIILIIIFFVILVISMWKVMKEKKTVFMMLFVLGFMIIIRYIVLNNHSYLHAFFTYRGLISMILAMLSMILLLLFYSTKNGAEYG